MVVRGKATSDKVGVLHELMSELMLEAKFDDKNIFKQLVLETRAGMESRVQGSGHSVAAGRLDAQGLGRGLGELSKWGAWRSSTTSASSSKRVDSDWDGVLADLYKRSRRA